MCGSLKREGLSELVGKDPQAEKLQASWGKMGESFVVKTKDAVVLAKFQGHAREETLSQTFIKNGWERGEVVVSAYNEKGKQYEVPVGSAVKVVKYEGVQGPVFNVVTRPAEGAEKQVHDRFPVVKKREF